MGNLTENVSDFEFQCKCTNANCNYKHDALADFRLVVALQDVVNYIKNKYKQQKVILIITSGNRCIAHNAKVGGLPDSKHTKALAADFQIQVDGKLITAYEIVDAIEKVVDLKVCDYKNIDSVSIHLEVDKD
jgi:uncharacterized protein YcbK (DUF882 family)